MADPLEELEVRSVPRNVRQSASELLEGSRVPRRHSSRRRVTLEAERNRGGTVLLEVFSPQR
eukprot:534731-Pyramimonas_sp.AAC.1